MPSCFRCGEHFASLQVIWKHFKYLHRLSAHSTFRCVENNCRRSFNNIKAYRRHWLLSHNNNDGSQLEIDSGVGVEGIPSSSCMHTLDVSVESQGSTSDGKDTPIDQTSVPCSDASDLGMLIKNDVLQMIGSLHSMQSLPRSNIQTIIELFQSFMTENMERLHDTIKEQLQNLSMPIDVISKTLKTIHLFESAFDDTDTEYKRFKVLKEKGLLHPPIPYTVGTRFNRDQSSNEGHVQMSPVEVKAQFFPLRHVLKMIFEIPNVYSKVLAYKHKLENEKIVLSNFIQGSFWRSKIQNMTNKEVLPLFLFFDDYETGNALGSHAGTNKLGGVYISIPCFPPEYQSSLNSIYHALLFFSKDRQDFGNPAIFGILIDELRFLENEGITLELAGKKTVVYFKLGVLVGDNLGLHSMLGFVESFNANFSCRFCKMTKADRSEACVEIEGLLRNTDSYNNDLLLNDVSLTGIKEKCAFLALDDFHPCNNPSVDIMHDVLEGACNFDMVEIINYLTEDACFFTLADLNSRLMCYDYGPVEKINMPPKLSLKHLKSGSIRMSAAEMWTFVRHFGLLCGDLVPENDPVWNFYVLLRQILALLTSTSLQLGCITLLKTLIQEHHSLYIQLFKKKLKPKHHHMIHYPQILRACGPLVHMWCMRFEGKHKPSKSMATVSSSKINIAATVAFRQQLKLANEVASQTIFSDALQIGPGNYSCFAELGLEFESNVELNTNHFFVKWLEKYGTRYKPNMAVCVGDDDGIPQFALIRHIIIQKEDILFVCQEIETMFINHVYAYEVCSTHLYHKLVNLKDLLHHIPCHVTKMIGCEFIVVRNML